MLVVPVERIRHLPVSSRSSSAIYTHTAPSPSQHVYETSQKPAFHCPAAGWYTILPMSNHSTFFQLRFGAFWAAFVGREGSLTRFNDAMSLMKNIKMVVLVGVFLASRVYLAIVFSYYSSILSDDCLTEHFQDHATVLAWFARAFQRFVDLFSAHGMCP